MISAAALINRPGLLKNKPRAVHASRGSQKGCCLYFVGSCDPGGGVSGGLGNAAQDWASVFFIDPYTHAELYKTAHSFRKCG
jgi:hypothetical protein